MRAQYWITPYYLARLQMYKVSSYIWLITSNTGWWWFRTSCTFPYIGNLIIPTDEVHHFSAG